ncbi:methyltransferase-like protein 17, mitochondrial [Colletes gigas]|uniref:methyltransferase-like protein 17, mitochondrial n=1 Tax=Colletes gigas TaxID=935657 RepID=UPI001C9AEB78|nr:methyltransferase-like protein 17, mitochondrial [Colletes gigas]
MTMKLTSMAHRQMRWYSTKEKMKVVDNIDELLLNNELKHRNHPGVIKPRQVQQPTWLSNAIKIVLKDEGISEKSIYASGQQLGLHLYGRQAPLENRDVRSKLAEVQACIEEKTKETIEKEDLLKNPKSRKLFKEMVYNWMPIQYDKYTCLSYLTVRSVPEYCVLCKIFNEINTEDSNFVPKSLFDYGSGIGTVMWGASQFWFKSIKEYYCVDASADMNELSEYLMKKAKPQVLPERIYYRQFLPASPTPTYDIVVSAYSLLELPDQKSRLEVILKLWQKTENYLIFVEQGTKAGFKIVNEARDFVLNYSKNTSNVHVFSPCPHDLPCPAYMNESTCNFKIVYQTLSVFKKSEYKNESYSYVVLKKGERPKDAREWPRIVKPVLKRSKHVICRMCTTSGKLQEEIFTTWKNGLNTYRCARSSELGDRLPFKIEEAECTKETK